MKNVVLEIYALAVCFVCLFVLSTTISIAAYSTISIVSPATTIYAAQIQPYMDNDSFRKTILTPDAGGADTAASDADVTKQREKALADLLDMQRSSGIQLLLSQAGPFVIGLILFLIHWSMAAAIRRSREYAAA
jgi:hypothetical protein